MIEEGKYMYKRKKKLPQQNIERGGRFDGSLTSVTHYHCNSFGDGEKSSKWWAMIRQPHVRFREIYLIHRLRYSSLNN